MAGEFTKISPDGSGYVATPQDVVKQDLPLLEALHQAPQNDPLVRREERSISLELANALQDLQRPQMPDMSHDDMINALAMQMLRRNEPEEAEQHSYDQLLGGADDYTGGGDMSSIFDEAADGGGFDEGYRSGFGAGESSQARYDGNYGSTDGGDYNQPFAGLYDGGVGDQGGYSAYGGDKGTTGLNSGAAFAFNSDGSVTSPDAKTQYSAPSAGTSHPDFLHVANDNLPGGFALNSEAKDGNTRSINGEVNGHKVEVWTDNDGSVKAQVDGKPVPKGGSDPNGIVTGNSDGSFTIKGSNDATGASIDVQVGANMVHGQQHGLTTQVRNVNGPNGQQLQVGGFIGNALRGQ